MAAPVPKLRAISARPVSVPIQRPLATASGAVTHAALVLVDLETEAGIPGAAYVFTPGTFALKPLALLIESFGEMLKGDPIAPIAIERKLRQRLTLMGVQGLAMLALGAIDVACWDVAAKAAGLPLVRLLGGVPGLLPAYNSNGLGIIGARAPRPRRRSLQHRDSRRSRCASATRRSPRMSRWCVRCGARLAIE